MGNQNSVYAMVIVIVSSVQAKPKVPEWLFVCKGPLGQSLYIKPETLRSVVIHDSITPALQVWVKTLEKSGIYGYELWQFHEGKFTTRLVTVHNPNGDELGRIDSDRDAFGHKLNDSVLWKFCEPGSIPSALQEASEREARKRKIIP